MEHLSGGTQNMDIYFIRHGQSTQNRGDTPVPYPPLTELGILQAKRAGEHLKDIGIRHLYSSPMFRALQTASIIGDAIGLAPKVLIELCEWGGVRWEVPDGGWKTERGLKRSEILARFPKVVLPDEVNEAGWWHRPVEPESEAMYRQVREHAEKVVALMRAAHLPNDETVALVSHGGSGATLLTAFLGFIPRPEYDCFWHNNTGITRILMTGDRTRLFYQNRVSHLSDDMITY